MTISEFIVLEPSEKRTSVLHQGILVAKRRDDEHLVFLFQIEDYYVETYFTIRNKAAVEYRAFKNLSSLEPYLEEIAIDGLFF